MSLAVFTDSTTAQASPALIFRPTSGNSTKTTSVNSCCAWSVMPIVPVSPVMRTHSCDFAYFKSDGTFAMAIIESGAMQRVNGNPQNGGEALILIFLKIPVDGIRLLM